MDEMKIKGYSFFTPNRSAMFNRIDDDDDDIQEREKNQHFFWIKIL